MNIEHGISWKGLEFHVLWGYELFKIYQCFDKNTLIDVIH